MGSGSELKMAASGDGEVTSLEEAAHTQVVKKLGGLAESITSRFSCGGVLSSSSVVQLFYKQRSGELASVAFPGADEAAIQQLLSACSVASFGMGSKVVTDKSYRDAVQLESDQFTTSFQLCDTPILGEVHMLMLPDLHTVQAKLYKLNVYAPGGHFKAHVDTPRSEQMFGTLVVCLPTQFSGGTLVTHHGGREVRFDWSSPHSSPLQDICWAAFFSDIEHEILPVTNGYRITLTYNLYSRIQQGIPETAPTIDITSNLFYSELRSAVSNAHFMGDGGVLGFCCHHAYVFEDLNEAKNLPFFLKGADRVVYGAADSLGLPVIVKPVKKSSLSCGYGDYDDDPCGRCTQYVLPEFATFNHNQYFYGDFAVHKSIKDIFGSLGISPDTKVTWCQQLTQWLPAATTMIEDTREMIYQAAAILVGVPNWGKRQTGAPEIGRKHKKTKGSAPAEKKSKSG